MAENTQWRAVLFVAALCLFTASCATMGTEAHMQKPKGKGPISSTLNDHKSTLEACIPQSYSLNAGESLRLIVTFTMSADGRVMKPDVETMSSPDPEFRGCILHKLKSIEFPPTVSGLDEPVRYPLIFVQSAG